MGVYIKGMKMPSGCISCPFKSYGTVDEFKYYCDMTGAFVGEWESKKLNQRHKDCPLIEEKTGHWEKIDIIHDRVDAKIQDWQQAKCSVCGRWQTKPYLYGVVLDPYCPHCGARMVEE